MVPGAFLYEDRRRLGPLSKDLPRRATGAKRGASGKRWPNMKGNFSDRRLCHLVLGFSEPYDMILILLNI